MSRDSSDATTLLLAASDLRRRRVVHLRPAPHRNRMTGQAGHFYPSSNTEWTLLRVRQQGQLERVELLARRTSLTVVHCRRANLHPSKCGNSAGSDGSLLVGRSVFHQRASAAQLDGLHGLARAALSGGSKLDQRNKTLATPLQSTVFVDDVRCHVHSKALGDEGGMTGGSADQITLQRVSTSALLVLEVEGDVYLEIVATIAGPLSVYNAEAVVRGRVELAEKSDVGQERKKAVS